MEKRKKETGSVVIPHWTEGQKDLTSTNHLSSQTWTEGQGHNKINLLYPLPKIAHEIKRQTQKKNKKNIVTNDIKHGDKQK